MQTAYRFCVFMLRRERERERRGGPWPGSARGLVPCGRKEGRKREREAGGGLTRPLSLGEEEKESKREGSSLRGPIKRRISVALNYI